MPCDECAQAKEAPYHGLTTVVAVPNLSPEWEAGSMINPNSDLNGGYPSIPAMPRRKGLMLYVTQVGGVSVPNTYPGCGVFVSSHPFAGAPATILNSQGAFFPASGSTGYSLDHAGPVFIRTFLVTPATDLVAVSWVATFEPETVVSPDVFPTIERDYWEGEPEVTEPQQPVSWPATDELDDITQSA